MKNRYIIKIEFSNFLKVWSNFKPGLAGRLKSEQTLRKFSKSFKASLNPMASD